MLETSYSHLSHDEWLAAQDKEERLKAISDEFDRLRGQAETTAEFAQNAEAKLIFGRGFWKLTLIILTGVIALINLLASSYPDQHYLPLFSAAVAVTLATLANIDSFLEYPRRAKENGDLYRNLRDASFRYACLHATYVEPMGITYSAYKNAFSLNIDFCNTIEQARATFKSQRHRQKVDGEESATLSKGADAA